MFAPILVQVQIRIVNMLYFGNSKAADEADTSPADTAEYGFLFNLTQE